VTIIKLVKLFIFGLLKLDPRSGKFPASSSIWFDSHNNLLGCGFRLQSPHIFFYLQLRLRYFLNYNEFSHVVSIYLVKALPISINAVPAINVITIIIVSFYSRFFSSFVWLSCLYRPCNTPYLKLLNFGAFFK
jgi:hypothetical protein